MKVKFTSTTNRSAKCIVGRECELSYGMQAYFEYDPEGLDFDYRKGIWSTSQITNIKIEEVSYLCYEITITTGNSEYVFEQGKRSEKTPLTQKEKLELAMAFGMHLV